MEKVCLADEMDYSCMRVCTSITQIIFCIFVFIPSRYFKPHWRIRRLAVFPFRVQGFYIHVEWGRPSTKRWYAPPVLAVPLQTCDNELFLLSSTFYTTNAPFKSMLQRLQCCLVLRDFGKWIFWQFHLNVKSRKKEQTASRAARMYGRWGNYNVLLESTTSKKGFMVVV